MSEPGLWSGRWKRKSSQSHILCAVLCGSVTTYYRIDTIEDDSFEKKCQHTMFTALSILYPFEEENVILVTTK